ncbi:MAG: acyl carrier protein [Crocinitomicaceae bacterium]
MEDFLIDMIEEIAFSTVQKNESLWQSGVLDSITIVELAVEIEKKYNIKVPFDEIIEANFETVALLIAYIEKKQSNA